MDDCLTRLTSLRAELAAARCVQLGERRGIALEAIDAAEGFATAAAQAIGEPALEPVAVLPMGAPMGGPIPTVLSEVAC
ncbi:hypothetical protein [Actinoplanes sp. L3-i22]|uniref:hypothetical protein n=1 Tax=Actinoplanes sp. L3-i22 TaxID=2836373 RepID=UPI001C85ED5A|nr:hypothetical protein [Actinoplanes sp. L3-i22]